MSRKQKLKARNRITRKMTRDGVVEQNIKTGEDIRISKREVELDLRGGNPKSESFYQLDKRGNTPRDSGDKKKNKNRRAAERAKDVETAVLPDTQPSIISDTATLPDAQPGIISDTPKQPDISADFQHTQDAVQAESQERGAVRPEQSVKPTDTKPVRERQVYQKTPPPKAKPPPVKSGTPDSRSALKHEDNSPLQFNREEPVTPLTPNKRKKTQRRNITEPQKPEYSARADPITGETVVIPPIIVNTVIPTDKKSEIPPPLKHEKRDRLRFEPSDTETQPLNKKKPAVIQTAQSTAETAKTAVNESPAVDSPAAENRQGTSVSPVETPERPDSGNNTLKHDKPDTPLQSEPNTPLHADNNGSQLQTDKPDTTLKPDKPGKLQFTSDEAAPAVLTRGQIKQGRKLERAQAQADRAVTKLEKAKGKLPSKKKIRTKTVLNEETGKAKRKLCFENEVKPQGEHLKGAKPLRPIKTVSNSALMFAHGKVFQVEHENVGVKAAHRAEMVAEAGVRSALHFRKTAPYRKVAKLERLTQKKSIKLSYQKALAENPKLRSNVFSRMMQKRKIKKQYAKAAREAQKTASRAKKAGATVGKGIKAVGRLLIKNPKVLLVLILVSLLLFMIMTLFTMCASIGSGGLGGILTASYLAEDADIDQASIAYTEWETDLRIRIGNTETEMPGYDEYRYNIGEISHNPFELMAYLTVLYQNFPFDAISADLLSLFNEQYTLTHTPSVETRYRTVTVTDPATGEFSEELEAYDWHVLTVTLTSRSLTEVIVSRLSGEQFAHYALLLQTKGARQYVGNPFGFDWLPYVSSYYGYRIHPISGVKDLHRGIDIGIAAGTPILSAQDGTVTFAGSSGGYGNVVIIENDKGIVTKYAHCDTILVTVGQPVKMGDTIATVGSTGSSTGPHLHFEVLKDGQYLNPLFFADTGSFALTPLYGFAGAPMGDGTFAAMIAEAEKFLGFPYVWGGSSPATSFDCSGFVSWVINQSGVASIGRQTAQGLFNLSNPVLPAEARPGDLIFFHSTYSAPHPVTHVGIYVGGNPRRMIHAGNPISYVSIDTPYWQNHFYAFGRIASD